MSIDKCPKCGCTEYKEINHDTIGDIVCEYDIQCKFCKYIYDVYSYGHFHSEQPGGEYYWCWSNVLNTSKNFILKIYYTVKRKFELYKLLKFYVIVPMLLFISWLINKIY